MSSLLIDYRTIIAVVSFQFDYYWSIEFAFETQSCVPPAAAAIMRMMRRTIRVTLGLEVLLNYTIVLLNANNLESIKIIYLALY